MKKTTRPAKRQTGPQAKPQLTDLVQQLFFAEETPPEEVDENPVVAYVLNQIRSAPVPADPLN
jgi:hypothetical protein